MIEVQDLQKFFGPKAAVGGVTFSVKKGEVLGFLGPNGAGKSTTMRMITGFIPPSAGSVKIGGHDIVADPLPAKRLVGYLPENAPSYADMTVEGFLSFAAELRGLTGASRKDAVERAITTCFLEGVRRQSVETLSKGFRHRTCLAQSIIHDPEVLILDEPTDGLDPNQKHEVRGLIKRMGETKAIIFSTHILEEVEAACSRAIIIDRGRIVANGTPAELKAQSEQAGVVMLRLSDGAANAAAAALRARAGVGEVTILEDSPPSLCVTPKAGWNGDELAASLGELALSERWKIRELRVEEGRLDEVFRRITRPDRDSTATDRTDAPPPAKSKRPR